MSTYYRCRTHRWDTHVIQTPRTHLIVARCTRCGESITAPFTLGEPAMLTNLTNPTWWKDAALRALYTALAIALPYLGAALIANVPWLTIALTASLGFVASLVTSIAGLPEVAGVNLPWWLAAVERVVKTFAQSLAAGFIGATLITDVPWSTVLQAAAIAALTSLVRLILATLPADPTQAPIGLVQNTVVNDGTSIKDVVGSVPPLAPADLTAVFVPGETLRADIPKGS